MGTYIDNYYWTFSAAAQCIAAITGFLLAGVALSFSVMDRLVERDSTYFELSETLKTKYHKQMSILAIISSVAITSNISFTFFNSSPGALREILFWTAVATDFLSIFLSTLFVINIISPKKYQSEAIKEVKNIQSSQSSSSQSPSALFFDNFLILERSLRHNLKEKNLYEANKSEIKMTFSFRQMVEALYQNRVIDSKFKEELLEVNKYRNLLFHGHIDIVSDEMLFKLFSAMKIWKNFYKNEINIKE